MSDTKVWDQKLQCFRYDLDEPTIAAQSLKDATRFHKVPEPSDHDATVRAFLALDPTKGLDANGVNALQASLRAHHSDGVGDGTAERNRADRKNNAAHNANSLADIKRDFKRYWPAVKESTLDAMVEAYTNQVEAGARSIILELLSSDPTARLAFASQEALDQVAEYCYHIESLEQSIAAVEAESAELREEYARAEMEAMYEEVLFVQPSAPAARRRSLQFEEPSPDNANLMNEEATQHLDPAMQKYVSAVERGTRRN